MFGHLTRITDHYEIKLNFLFNQSKKKIFKANAEGYIYKQNLALLIWRRLSFHK